MNLHEIETPAVVIDIDILDRNIRNMANYCALHTIALRRHTKTHKIPAIAHMQLKYGAPELRWRGLARLK